MWSKCFFIVAMLFPFGGFSQCEILVWSDEFDGNELNEDNWSFQIGNGCPQLCGWGNNELQYYTDRDENIGISNGLLTITGRQESFAGSDYTSARIRSINKLDFCMGRVEARMKVPAGQGYWPALWMLPSETYYGSWPTSGEIDIMEVSGNNTDDVVGTIHFGPLWPENQYTGNSYTVTGPDLSEEFHLYEIEWSENELKWYVDGILYSTKTPDDLYGNPWNFDRNFHLIINLAIGGWFPGFPDGSTEFPGTLEVDYVRVYQTLEETVISGRSITQVESTETYYCAELPEAIYAWSVSGDASIGGGQGTSEISLQLGQEDVTLSVEISVDECSSVISKEIETIGNDCDGIFSDFQDRKELYRIKSDGNYNNISGNPVQNEVNPSLVCGSYVRNSSVQYDALLLATDVFGDPQSFIDGDFLLAMDVFTSEPPGRTINLQFESQPLASGGYPLGRHSVYTSSTELSGAWHTLYFDHIQSPDGNFGDNIVNQLTILFEPNSFENSVFFFDNLRVVSPDCQSNAVSEMNSPEFEIFPNPGNGNFQITLKEIGRYHWELCHSDGRVLRSGMETGDRFSLTDLLIPGSYFLRIQDEKGFFESKKIIVQ